MTYKRLFVKEYYRINSIFKTKNSRLKNQAAAQKHYRKMAKIMGMVRIDIRCEISAMPAPGVVSPP